MGESSMIRSAGFTLIELVAVIVVLAILAAVAVPQYVSYAREAEYRMVDAVAGAVSVGVSHANTGLLLGDPSPLIVDADVNGFIDHLGDVTHTEPTILDAVMDPPLENMRGKGPGWKTFDPVFNATAANYFYDVDGDDMFDSTPLWREPTLVYYFGTGRLVYFPDVRGE